jgi:hypothetical protein
VFVAESLHQRRGREADPGADGGERELRRSDLGQHSAGGVQDRLVIDQPRTRHHHLRVYEWLFTIDGIVTHSCALS